MFALSIGPLASIARAGAPIASAVAAEACTEEEVVTQEDVSTYDDVGIVDSQTITRTLTVAHCESALTLAPASGAPLAAVTATLSEVQPVLCTQEQRVVVRYIYTSVFDEHGNFLGYSISTTTSTTFVTVCEANSAIVRFNGVAVAMATPIATGLRATFVVPNLSPGTYTVSATPVAGNAASATFTVLDTISPLITGSAAPSSNAAGWNDGDVTVTFACFDADSGIQSCTSPVTLSGEGAGQSVTGTALDNAGNSATATVDGINIDRTAPTITPRASRVPDAGVWYTAPVTIAFDCVDTLSGVALCSGPVTLSDDGRAVIFTSEAFDNAGNGVSFAGTVNIDTTPPTITAPPDVVTGTAAGTCAASPALGTPVATDNVGSVTVSTVAPASFPKGTTNVTWIATDSAGHSASATQTVTVNDTERPTVVAPPDVTATATSAAGAVIATAELGSTAASDNCDGAIAAAVSGIPAGNLFPIGTTTLTWTATDAGGNTSSVSQPVTVSYDICLLYDPAKAAKLGSTIAIKLQLCAGGTNLSSASLVPNATTLVRTGSTTTPTAEDSGNANPDNNFRYDATLGGTGGYIYNLSTTSLSSGSWLMFFTLNGQTYSVPFQVR
jgi:hypothetical protein